MGAFHTDQGFRPTMACSPSDANLPSIANATSSFLPMSQRHTLLHCAPIGKELALDRLPLTPAHGEPFRQARKEKAVTLVML